MKCCAASYTDLYRASVGCVSANALMVVYFPPTDCPVLLPKTVVVAVSWNFISHLPAPVRTGGWNNFFRSLLKNCSVKQDVNCLPHSDPDTVILSIFLVSSVTRLDSEHPWICETSTIELIEFVSAVCVCRYLQNFTKMGALCAESLCSTNAGNRLSLYHSHRTTTLALEVCVCVHNTALQQTWDHFLRIDLFVYLGRNEKKNARREN